MELRHQENSIRFIDPIMPAFLDWVAIAHLRLGESRVKLRLHRHDGDVSLNLLDRSGDAKVMLVK
jgi:hypothetical protein